MRIGFICPYPDCDSKQEIRVDIDLNKYDERVKLIWCDEDGDIGGCGRQFIAYLESVTYKTKTQTLDKHFQTDAETEALDCRDLTSTHKEKKNY